MENRFHHRLQHHLCDRLRHAIGDRRHGRIELHFDAASLWDRLRLRIRFIPYVVRSLSS